VANQIRTVSRHRIGQALGRLAPDEIADLDRALRIQLALDAQ
jgi:mRNA-degrading endonuclease toxin of MazEF toxin-antitoxin module